LRRRNKKPAWLTELKARMKEGLEMCVECGSTENLTVDHILPISKGGDTVPENVQVMCGPCNWKKDSEIPEGLEAQPMRAA
jgi:5-methylcytosine-specific restriction endonuclease McrA